MDDALLLAGAAFLAGALNTVAGGGTFLTFPALVSVGIPPVAANATSAVAVFPGYLGGAFGFRRELAGFDRRLLLRATALTALGGLAGSLLLLISSDAAFSAIIPFLLASATAIFAFSGQIQRWARRRSRAVAPGGAFATLAVAVYGGYFNGGLGIVLLALFALWGLRDIHAMNGLKNALSFVLSAISVMTFASAGVVAWPQALIMMAAAVSGGYLGAPLARALPERVVRGIVIGVGVTMSVIFFYRLVAAS